MTWINLNREYRLNKSLTWCLNQNQKVYILVDQNFSSWNKISVFSDWSTLFSNCGFELDLDEQRQFVDRNYCKNSFFTKSFSHCLETETKNYKNVFEFSQEETISEEFILALNTFDTSIPWDLRYIHRRWIIGYIHRRWIIGLTKSIFWKFCKRSNNNPSFDKNKIISSQKRYRNFSHKLFFGGFYLLLGFLRRFNPLHRKWKKETMKT